MINQLARCIIDQIETDIDTIPFLDQFKILRDKAQIAYYDVDLRNKEKRYSDLTSIIYTKPIDNNILTIGPAFSEKLLLAALKRRREKVTSYSEFLEDLARAGVVSYRVDMVHNKATYFGAFEEYSENIPV